MYQNGYDDGLKDTPNEWVHPLNWDQERGSYCNNNGHVPVDDIPQESMSYNGQNPTTLNKTFASSRCFMTQDLRHINLNHSSQNVPIFQIEYGILLSELLKECHLRLKDLKFSENRAECAVMNENGQLKKIIIQRNPQDPQEYLTQNNIRHDFGFPIAKTSGNEPKLPEMKDSSTTKFRHGLLAPINKSYNNFPRNNNVNKKLSTSNKHYGSNCICNSSDIGQNNLYHAPNVRHIYHQLGNKSNDLSLYEETRRHKTGNVTTIERFQQYTIQPTTDMNSNVAQNSKILISRVSDDTQISPQIYLAKGRMCVEKQSEPISKTNFNLQSSTLGNNLTFKNSTLPPADGEPFNEIFHKNVVQKDINCLEPINNSSDSKQNYNLKAWLGKKISKPSSTLSKLGTAIPHVEFIKPPVIQSSSNNIKGYIFSSNKKLKKSVSKTKRDCFKEPSTTSSYIRYVNQSRKLKPIGISKGSSLVTVDRHKKNIFQLEPSYEVEKASTEGIISNETHKDKENDKRDQIKSGLYSTNQIAEGVLNLLETGPSKMFQEIEPYSKPAGVRNTDIYSAPKEHVMSLRTGFRNKYKLNFTKDMSVNQTKKYLFENETQEPMTYANTQEEIDYKVPKEENRLYNLNVIKGQTSTTCSSLKCLINTRIVDHKLNTKKRCTALNKGLLEGNEFYQIHSANMSDKRESIHSTTDTVAQINLSAPISTMIERTIDKVGSLSETKEQQLLKLKDQIGKISSSNNEDQSVTEKSLWPRNISTSIKYNGPESPEFLWHKQKVRRGREAYLQSYKVRKWTPPLVKENPIKRKTSIFNWGYEAKGFHNMDNCQVNQLEGYTALKGKSESKEIENKSTDNDECCIM